MSKRFRFMVFNATFNNISYTQWQKNKQSTTHTMYTEEIEQYESHKTRGLNV